MSKLIFKIKTTKEVNHIIMFIIPIFVLLIVSFFTLSLFAQAEADNAPVKGSVKPVSFETTKDYVHNIYANGNPLLIVASEKINYAKLYIDENQNGIGEPEEEITDFKGDGTLSGNGIYYSDDYGYFLTNTAIYGGAKDGDCTYDTHITLTGESNSEQNDLFTVNMIFGGNQNGTLYGSTNVTISGGNAGWVFGGGKESQLHGNTNVNVRGGCVLRNLYGGCSAGNIAGNTNIEIKNTTVSNVFGGNEYWGKVEGSTYLLFGKNTKAYGWVYGGGAGFSDSEITEVTGSTTICINGGIFYHNVYGGGGWRGAKVDSSHIYLNGGTFYGDVYGGGEETSTVSNEAEIIVDGATANSIYAGGAGFNGTTARVGSSNITLKSGMVSELRTLRNDETQNALVEDLSWQLQSDSFSKTILYIGDKNSSGKLQNVNISVKNGKTFGLNVQSPIEQSFFLLLDNGDILDIVMSENVLSHTSNTQLCYENCGAPENNWGEYNYMILSANVKNSENPILSCQNWNHNRFQTITLKNSYINFVDLSSGDNDEGMRACTDRLIVDNTALRIICFSTSYMPDTILKNNPLLLRTSSSEPICFYDSSVEGKARIQWLSADGVSVPKQPYYYGIVDVQNPPEIKDDTFTSAIDDYCLKTENISYHSPSTGTSWQGKRWIVGTLQELCTCWVYKGSLEERVFAMPVNSQEQTVTLKDTRTGSGDCSANCHVVGHPGTVSDFEYSIIPEGTTAKGAVLNHDKLTFSGPGKIHIQVTQKLYQKTSTYETTIYVVGIPEKNNLSLTIGNIKNTTILLSGDEFFCNDYFSYLWNPSTHNYLGGKNYTIDSKDGQLEVILKKEYLETLSEGDHLLELNAYLTDTSPYVRYCYLFTLHVAPPKEVTAPKIEFDTDKFHYDGTAKEPDIIVKDGNTIIPPDEYSVSYKNNINEGIAQVIITNKEGGDYIVSGSAEFKIINDYEPKKNIDYTVTDLNKQGWCSQSFVISANEGFLISTQNTLADEWSASLTKTEETANGSITFYVKNLTNGRISKAVTEHYKIDLNAPKNCDITFQGNSVLAPIAHPSFDLLFANTIQVCITAQDSLSGISSIAYYPSEKELSLEQLAKVENWVEEKEFPIPAVDGKKFIIYARAVDNGGNITYFGTKGAEFDLTPPAFHGAIDGHTYYTTQSVNVTDLHLANVTLNEKSVDGEIILPGNTEQRYILKAVDAAGNESRFTIIMKPLSLLSESLSKKNEQNVTSLDLEMLNHIIEVEQTIGSHSTTKELEELSQLISKAALLHSRVTQAVSALEDSSIKAAADITKDNVKSKDKKILETARDALLEAKMEYQGNYTPQQQQQIQWEIDRISGALDSIDNSQQVTDLIRVLPNVNQANLSDKNLRIQVTQAKAAYDGLSAHEKTLIPSADVNHLQLLVKAFAKYDNLGGSDNTDNDNTTNTDKDNDKNKDKNKDKNNSKDKNKGKENNSGKDKTQDNLNDVNSNHSQHPSSNSTGAEDKASSANPPKAGDTIQAFLWFFVMIAAIAIIIVFPAWRAKSSGTAHKTQP